MATDPTQLAPTPRPRKPFPIAAMAKVALVLALAFAGVGAWRWWSQHAQKMRHAVDSAVDKARVAVDKAKDALKLVFGAPPLPSVKANDDDDYYCDVTPSRDTPGARQEAAAKPDAAKKLRLKHAVHLVNAGKVDEAVQALYQLRDEPRQPRNRAVAGPRILPQIVAHRRVARILRCAPGASGPASRRAPVAQQRQRARLFLPIDWRVPGYASASAARRLASSSGPRTTPT